MMKLIHLMWLMVAFLFATALGANDIQVGKVRLVDDDPGNSVSVSFNISWENSWRTSAAPSNWDAAWIFVKYRAPGGLWQHAFLSQTGHDAGTGTAAIMMQGLKDDKQVYDAATNPGVGMMVFRSQDGSGTFASTGMKLRWNYGASGNGLTNLTGVEVQVYAIEMIFVPSGPFFVGDGSSYGTLRQVGSNIPFEVTATGAPMKCADSADDDAQFEGSGIWVSGTAGISKSAATETDMNPDYPTGYQEFYAMKYEISQGQYRDFLNTLTRTQQIQRVAANISGTSVFNRYVVMNQPTPLYRSSIRCDATLPVSDPVEFYCDLDADGIRNEPEDGEWLACTNLNWADGVAYLDWSGLRPLTELEFEKICRGPNTPIAAEYPWGTNTIASSAYTLTDGGKITETINQNYSTTVGNASYAATAATSIIGPNRVGAFAAHPSSTNRVSAGAGYYGHMELAGNAFERTVSMGNLTGRSFNGLHGDGSLSSQGLADVPTWPGANAVGSGLKGGNWFNSSATSTRVSNRFFGALADPIRSVGLGFRGARTSLSQ
jgi:formylglycine-generating enzyme required for sulfatase activity